MDEYLNELLRDGFQVTFSPYHKYASKKAVKVYLRKKSFQLHKGVPIHLTKDDPLLIQKTIKEMEGTIKERMEASNPLSVHRYQHCDEWQS